MPANETCKSVTTVQCVMVELTGRMIQIPLQVMQLIGFNDYGRRNQLIAFKTIKIMVNRSFLVLRSAKIYFVNTLDQEII